MPIDRVWLLLIVAIGVMIADHGHPLVIPVQIRPPFDEARPVTPVVASPFADEHSVHVSLIFCTRSTIPFIGQSAPFFATNICKLASNLL